MSQSSGCWKLPHELIDTIIDELHREPAGLVPCALVHSTWRPRAQHHLFNDMTFNLAPPLPVPEHQQLHRLADSLADNPKLASLVQYLKIQGSCAIASEIHFEILQSGCKALLRVIPLLANVQTVTVADFVGNLSWDRLSYSLQNAIFKLLFHPSVTSVHILGVHGIPLLPLAQCKHLECLEIEYVSPDPAELDAPFPLTFGEAFALGDCDAPRRHLHTLALSNTSDSEICRYLLKQQAIDFSALKGLRLRYFGWDSPETKSHLLSLLHPCKESLKWLKLVQGGYMEYVDHPQPFPPLFLQLDLLPNLRSLALELNWYYLEYIPEQSNLINEICDGLKLLAVPGNALESFELTITFDHPIGDDMSLKTRIFLSQHIFFEPWAALDEVLSSPHFKLRQVSSALHAGRNVADATVVLDYQQVKCPGQPIPQDPTAAFQILSGMTTLQIVRLPMEWCDTEECFVWPNNRERVLLSGDGVPAYTEELLRDTEYS